jgi:hypothetical protein
MRLYIEKILNRVLDAQGFEETLASEWKKPSVSSPVSPTTGSLVFNNNNNNNYNNNNSQEDKKTTKKVERHKTVSGWHFRSTSQPQNSYNKISEEADTTNSLPSRKSNDNTLHPLSEVPKRALRNSTSASESTKRFSIFGWGGGVEEEERKEDPFMRPMILLQEQERKE